MPDPTPFTGVFPCYEGQFQIKVDNTFEDIADVESFSIAIDNGIEEWNPYNAEGWVRRLMTAKSIAFSCSGKRNVGDTGNDAIASYAFKNGRDAEGDFKVNFKNGDSITLTDAIISVTAYEYGDSTNVAPLEFEVQSNGKPTITYANG
ncbi:MAG: hypothetical protein K5643_05265 [Saccharofermentans sp.]|jgi:hypothetical protein|nr:hypothetical protein [Saccharofermentans sp.]